MAHAVHLYEYDRVLLLVGEQLVNEPIKEKHFLQFYNLLIMKHEALCYDH